MNWSVNNRYTPEPVSASETGTLGDPEIDITLTSPQPSSEISDYFSHRDRPTTLQPTSPASSTGPSSQFRQAIKRQTPMSIDFVTTEDSNKRWTCPICPKRFLSPSAVEQHIRTHTGEKPFPCDICQKRFTTLSNLRRHQRWHSRQAAA